MRLRVPKAAPSAADSHIHNVGQSATSGPSFHLQSDYLAGTLYKCETVKNMAIQFIITATLYYLYSLQISVHDLINVLFNTNIGCIR